MSAGNDYWPAKVETMRKIEANLQAKLAEQAETIEKLREAAEVNQKVAERTIYALANERDKLRTALEKIARFDLDKFPENHASAMRWIADNALQAAAEPKPLPTESVKVSDRGTP